MEISSNLTSTQSITARVCRAKNYRGFRAVVLPNSTLEIYCGLRSKDNEINNFLSTNHKWLLTTFSKIERNINKFPIKSYVSGEELQILGQSYKIVETYVNTVEAAGGELRICTNWGFFKRKKEIQKFYKKIAAKVICQRVLELAQEMGLNPKEVCFRNNRTLWGSCHPDGRVFFNIKLVCAPINIIDYVVIHELSHLQIPNHSGQFWSLVERYCLNHKQCRSWLRKNYYTFDFLNEISDLHECKID